MPPSKTRFVTACQQLLALAVVLAALTPAASVVSLDVVQREPGTARSGAAGSGAVGDLAAYTRAASRKSLVAAAVGDAVVEEHSLTAPTGQKSAALGLAARTRPGARPGSVSVVGRPQPVSGFGTVGVTWAPDDSVDEDDLTVRVRTLDKGQWTDWTELEYHDEHGPDPDSREGRRARPGTEELLVGRVEQVQVAAVSASGTLPADMKLAVIAPGEVPRTAVEAPAIDTGELAPTGSSARRSTSEPTPNPEPETEEPGEEDLDLQASVFTPKPVIYSRAQWGADERLRDKGSLRYFEVHAGFMHHTVNSNDYKRRDVPALLRSIYAYHTQSKGWSDIGYNYLVDRFGRIWEGRFGGVDRPVVGAHTLGYNDYAFAMSAIGNYDVKKPSRAMVQAYGALFAWKLSLHGVDASSPRQVVGSKTFPAINGHRDAGSTACPGRYLYSRLGQVRRIAAQTQRGWAGRELESDLAASPHPDLVVRRAGDGRVFVIPTGGLTQFELPVPLRGPWRASDTVVAAPDLTGDGHSDLLVQVADGSAQVYPGNGNGGVGEPIKKSDKFANHDLVTAAGDLTGNGNIDFVARRTASGKPDLYIGGGKGGFVKRHLPGDWSSYDLLTATGDLNGDGKDDLVARDGSGRLWLIPGTGSRRLGQPVQIPGNYGTYDTITGFGDFNRDGRADLFVRNPGKPGYILPSRGDGTFDRRLGPVQRPTGADFVTAVDLIGNAAPDLLVRRGDELMTYPSTGGYETGRPIDSGVQVKNANTLLNAGDWDRDGHGDIIVRSGRSGALFLRRGDGQGHFGKSQVLAKGFGGVGLLAAVGDMTGDGWPDLMGQPRGSSMRLYPGKGLEGLRPSYVAYGSVSASTQVAVGRWDGDGAPDTLFRAGDQLRLYPGNGPGGLIGSSSLNVNLRRYDWVIGVSDVTLSGRPDLLVRKRSNGTLWLLQATAKGFTKPRYMASGLKGYDLAG
ncbi:FG-GAP-like repeat-containing protein [Nocardioides sp.]|uniref:FG-GAP-like repeat-containing protein n=1 Tax=Nocardioides sp. TaxID=35761 RepID=UPI003561B134